MATTEESARRVRLGDGWIDLGARRVVRSGGEAHLTPHEAELVQYLAERARTDVAREELLREVWGASPRVVTRALDHTVSRLRRKLEIDPAEPAHLLTAHGVGYRWVPATEHVALHDGAPDTSAGAFVGRADELLRIEQAFARGAALVSIVGGPGIGKTRLAIEHARAERGRGEREVRFVDLSGCGGTDALRTTLALALDVEAVGLAAALASGTARLVVLDNLEHLLPEAVDVLGPLVSASPAVRWLVTSREALRLTHEVRLELGPLGLEEAARMLGERARAHGAELDAGHPDALRVCERLEGRPLAIELAAGRVSMVGLSELAERVLEPFVWLRARARDLPERHRGMWEAIEWSWRGLDARERDALVAVSSARAEIDLEAAVGLIGAPDAHALLERLVDLSLVERWLRGGRVSFRVAAIVREFAWASDEAARARAELHDRHAEVMLRAVERASASSSLLHELSAVVERGARPSAVIEAALAIDARFDGRVALSERASIVERACTTERLAAVSEALVCRAWIARAGHAGERGEVALAEARFDRAQEAASTDAARAAIALGRARALRATRPTEAAQHAEAAERLARAVGETGLALDALRLAGVIALDGGDGHRGRATLQRCLVAAERAGLERARVILWTDLGRVLLDAGELDEAAACFRDAMLGARALGDERREASAASNLAFLEHLEGRLSVSLARQEAALEVHRRVGHRRFEAFALAALGALHHELGELPRAQRRLMEAEALLAGVDPVFHAYVSARLGALLAELGDEAGATELFQRAEALFRERGMEARLRGLAAYRALLCPARALEARLRASRDAFDVLGVRLHASLRARLRSRR